LRLAVRLALLALVGRACHGASMFKAGRGERVCGLWLKCMNRISYMRSEALGKKRGGCFATRKSFLPQNRGIFYGGRGCRV
jgi:hypothetical protein